MHIYIYIYTYIYLNIYIHIFEYIYICIYIYTYVYLCVHIFLHLCICIYACIYIYVYIYIHCSFFPFFMYVLNTLRNCTYRHRSLLFEKTAGSHMSTAWTQRPTICTRFTTALQNSLCQFWGLRTFYDRTLWSCPWHANAIGCAWCARSVGLYVLTTLYAFRTLSALQWFK